MNKIASNARLKASLEEMAQLGSPVDLSVAVTEFENEKVEIEQVGGIVESHLFELEDRRVACIANIAVTNQTARPVDVVDVELRATWDDSLFQWLTPRPVKPQGGARRDSGYSVYQFPGKHGLQLGYDEVINHVLLERKRLPAKRRLEGWLLGIGGLMPPGPLHGQWLDIHLTIIGADHAEYARTIRLWTERLLARTKIVKPRTSIFPRIVEEEAMLARDVTCTEPRPGSQTLASKRT